MRNVIFLISLSLAFFFSCSTDAQLKEKLLIAEKALHEAHQALAEAEEIEGVLVHAVFLKLKEGSTMGDLATCVGQLSRLKDLEMVKAFKVGSFEELGDVRAMSDYDIGLLVTLEDREAYNAYQTNELHVEVRDILKEYLGAPPLTFDFFDMGEERDYH